MNDPPKIVYRSTKEVAERTVERGAGTVVLEMKDGHMVVLADASMTHNSDDLEEYIASE